MSTFNSRYNPRVPMSFRVEMEGQSGKCKGRVVNLSNGGIQVMSDNAHFAAGDQVHVQFRLPRWADRIECNGEVVYQHDDRIGIRFSWSPLSDSKYLDLFMRESLEEEWYF